MGCGNSTGRIVTTQNSDVKSFQSLGMPLHRILYFAKASYLCRGRDDVNIVDKRLTPDKSTIATSEYLPSTFLPGQNINYLEIPSVESLCVLATDDATKVHTIALRGTKTMGNVMDDAEMYSVVCDIINATLHKGINDVKKGIKKGLTPHLNEGYSLQITGHSLGGASAILLAVDYALNGWKIDSVVTFGSPRVGKTDFLKVLQDLQNAGQIGPVVRVVELDDIIPHLPPRTVLGFETGYIHIGNAIYLDDTAPDSFAHLTDFELELNREVTSDWGTMDIDDLKSHFLSRYIKSIETMVKGGAKEICFADLVAAAALEDKKLD